MYGRAPLNPKITPPSPPPGRGATAGTGLDPHFIVARYAPVRCDRCRPPDGRGFGETPGRMGGTLREGGGVGCWVKWGGLSRGDGPHVEEKAGRETGHAASCVGGTGGKEVAKVGGVGGIPEPRGGPQPDPPPPPSHGGAQGGRTYLYSGRRFCSGTRRWGGVCVSPQGSEGRTTATGPPPNTLPYQPPSPPYTPRGGGGGVSPPPPAAPALAQVSGSGGGGGLSPAGGTPPAAPNWPRCPRRWSRARGGGGSER